ncbi:hypothetical protein TWF192_002283 [Orbilia oligospora]|uniref:DUF4604 domain-containing protein n=1 Tax=Orbilia oligospora TaxID=2813651 RepID=A0A6G1MFJ3_ORBOL|nr:hypothetical protein TWF679_007211 [Orbilia oligospora]KAF3224076.1 hypothetical protein TWF191_006192 [Orbilia oligospora]KAF3255845.1 hypothetical protein TWF192_002283 [Orbilia oligospora]
MAHKNLSYESKEPAFLQRLRAQTAGVYQERPLNRPKKQRNPEDEEEDEPVYVLEDNTTLSGREFDALKEETAAKAKSSEEEEGQEADPDKVSKGDLEDKSKRTKNEKSKDSVLEIGVKTQKRKIAKVVGAEASDDEANKADRKDKEDEAPKKKKPRPKQKVKLSFGDD